MSRRVPDLSVYLVTDRLLARGRELVDVVLAAVRGGATVVQLREKESSARETSPRTCRWTSPRARRRTPRRPR